MQRIQLKQNKFWLAMGRKADTISFIKGKIVVYKEQGISQAPIEKKLNIYQDVYDKTLLDHQMAVQGGTFVMEL